MACRLGGKTGEDPTSRVARTLDHGFCTRAYFAPMRAKRFQMLAILAVVLTVLAVPALVRAATVGEIRTLAESYLPTTCVTTSTEITCDRGVLRTWPWVLHAVIQPGSGQSTNLVTQGTTSSAIQAGGLDAQTRGWMTNLHALACGDPKGSQRTSTWSGT